MKKIIAFGLLAFAAFGGQAALAHAECSDPVSVDCSYVDDNGREIDCLVYINTAETGLLCINA